MSIKMETLFHTIMSTYFAFQVHFLFLIKKALQRAFHMVQIFFIWKQMFFFQRVELQRHFHFHCIDD